MNKVCFLNSISFWGGGEKLHLEYAIAFTKKKYNVIIASNKKAEITKRAKESDIAVFGISVTNRSFLNPFKIAKLVRFFKQNAIDTVIFSTSQDLKLGGIAAKIAKVQRIVYLRGLAVPIKNSFINRYFLHTVLTHIVANSEETKRKILQNIPILDLNEKIRVIYHGIEIPELGIQQPLFLKEIQDKKHGIVLGNAGRLTEQKGQQHLIEIAKQLRDNAIDFTLFIAGEGEMHLDLQKAIEANNLQKHVYLLGFVKEMDCFMHSIDIFLLTSLWEGFGYVLVEAMIQSKPVVAFNVSSNGEIVTNNKTGFLIDTIDIPLFATKVQTLIMDINLGNEFGKNGKHSVLKRFSLYDRISEFETHLLMDNKRK